MASPPTWAFTDGSGCAAVSYLIKLVEHSIHHYQQPQRMIQYSKDAQAYMHEINSGLEAFLQLMGSLLIKDEKSLSQLRAFQRSRQAIETIYGAIPNSLSSNSMNLICGTDGQDFVSHFLMPDQLVRVLTGWLSFPRLFK